MLEGVVFSTWSHVIVGERGVRWWVREGANANGGGKPGSRSCLDEYSLTPLKASLVLAAVSAC